MAGLGAFVLLAIVSQVPVDASESSVVSGEGPSAYTVFIVGSFEILKGVGRDIKLRLSPLFMLATSLLDFIADILAGGLDSACSFISFALNFFSRLYATLYRSLCLKVPAYQGRPELCG